VTDSPSYRGLVDVPDNQPVPPMNEEWHGRQRTRRLALGVLTALVSRGTGAIAPILLIPITLNYLGPQIYGLWMAVGALAGMTLWADLGLGNGLLTKLTPCVSSGDWAAARRYTSTAYAVLVPTAFTIAVLLWLLAGVIPWSRVFSVSDPSLDSTARIIAVTCLAAFVINIPLSLIQRVQYACQQVAQNNIWQAAGTTFSVLITWLAVSAKLQPTVIVAAAVSGPLIANAANSLWVYSREGRRLRPRLRSVDRSVITAMFQIGGQFFILSIVTSVALNADNLIIARTLGLTAVTEYSVPSKVFTGLGLMVTLINLPLWPANGDALTRGDYNWVRKTTSRMTVLSGVAVLLPVLAFFLIGDKVLSRWLKADLHGSPWLFLGLGIWWILLATAAPRFMVQNASGLVLPQLVGWILYLVLSVPAKLLLANTFGVAGVAIVGSIGYALLVWPAAAIGYRKALSMGTLARPQTEVE
jgi:O-antigen/teichoic acid export membrane protein